MRCFSPDTSHPSGTPDRGAPDHGGDSSTVPSGMDNDPNADEEIIDQQADKTALRDEYPQPADNSKRAPDNLADSIAYALDGSGPGPTNDTPNVSGHDVITKGITGADLTDEAAAMRT